MARSVTIIAGQYNVELPNGFAYNALNATTTNGPTVILSDEEGAKLNPAAAGVVYVDNGTLVGPVRSVTIVAGAENVQLPNGVTYDATHPATTNGPTVYLSEEEGSRLGVINADVLVDNGWLPEYAVTVQAANTADPTAQTAVAVTTTAATTTTPYGYTDFGTGKRHCHRDQRSGR